MWAATGLRSSASTARRASTGATRIWVAREPSVRKGTLAARSTRSIALVPISVGTNDATGIQSGEPGEGLIRADPSIAAPAINTTVTERSPPAGARLGRGEILRLDLGRRVAGRLQDLLGRQRLGRVGALAPGAALDRDLEFERPRGQVETGRGRIGVGDRLLPRAGFGAAPP